MIFYFFAVTVNHGQGGSPPQARQGEDEEGRSRRSAGKIFCQGMKEKNRIDKKDLEEIFVHGMCHDSVD